MRYGVRREDSLIDFDEVRRLAKEYRPRLIVAGASAYPRVIDADRVPRDRRRGGGDADGRHGPLRRARGGRHPPEPGRARRRRHVDDAQDAGRPAVGAWCCAGASTRRRSTRPSSPGCRAGRCATSVAAKAVCFKLAATSDGFQAYQRQIVANAQALAATLIDGGLDLLTGGTDIHLIQLDLRRTQWSGKDAEERLHEVAITVNRNTVPFDERPPTIASGVRIGTPAATMRGFAEDDMREVGAIILDDLDPAADLAALRRPHPRAAGGPAALRGVPAWPLRASDAARCVVDHPLVAAQACADPRPDDHDARFPLADGRARGLPLLRGDPRSGGRADRRARRRSRRRAARRSRARSSAWSRCCGPGSACSTPCSISSRWRASASSASTATSDARARRVLLQAAGRPDERDVLVLDPMLATGGSASAALGLCKQRGSRSIRLLSVVAAPVGLRADRRRPPGRHRVHRRGRPRAQRRRLHPARPGRRRRPAVRHAVTPAVTSPRGLTRRSRTHLPVTPLLATPASRIACGAEPRQAREHDDRRIAGSRQRQSGRSPTAVERERGLIAVVDGKPRPIDRLGDASALAPRSVCHRGANSCEVGASARCGTEVQHGCDFARGSRALCAPRFRRARDQYVRSSNRCRC